MLLLLLISSLLLLLLLLVITTYTLHATAPELCYTALQYTEIQPCTA